MKVLITGSEGYLGALAAPELMRAGHEVLGLDTGYYKSGWLCRGADRSPQTLDRDLRRVTIDDLAGMDAIVHMAELSNDPLGELSPEVTQRVNHGGSVRLAALAKQAGASRFVYMSSCSVYGIAVGRGVTESAALNPQTPYARCKALVERDVAALAGEDFSPTFLRNATAYGASPRMRFDIVLNNLCGRAWTAGEIAMTSDGTPWRPLVHGLDITKAIRCVLAAPREVVHNEVFNVGSGAQNYQIKEIADLVASVFTDCRLSFGDSAGDNRSYRIDCDKIHSVLPGFSCDWDARLGVRQLYDVFARVQLAGETFTGRDHNRLRQLQYLLDTGQVDADLFWTY